MFKLSILKIHTVILLAGILFAGLVFCPAAKAANQEAGASTSGSGKRIVKWVDSSGATHYGDKLPVQETGRNNTEMSNQGVVLKRNVQADSKTEQQDQEKLAAQRKDNILLASYTNAEEIDLARDRNLQMDQAALQALTVQKQNVADRTTRNQKNADSFRKRKKPLPPYLSDELKLAKSESNRIDKQIAERKLSMEATRKRFADEKSRFIALKQSITPKASAMAPSAATSQSAAPSAPAATPAPSKTTAIKPK